MKVILDETGILKKLRRGALPAADRVTQEVTGHISRPPVEGPSIQS